MMSMLSLLHVVQFNDLGLSNSFDARAERVASALNDRLALRESD